MPKNKKLESSSDSSDSDSGPDDRNPPPKKAKSESSSSPVKSSGASGSAAKSSSKKPGEEESWELDKKRVVKINEFRGRVFVDIREYYEDKGGDLKPGKKGISLSAQQYQKLKDIIPEIDAALKNH